MESVNQKEQFLTTNGKEKTQSTLGSEKVPQKIPLNFRAWTTSLLEFRSSICYEETHIWFNNFCCIPKKKKRKIYLSLSPIGVLKNIFDCIQGFSLVILWATCWRINISVQSRFFDRLANLTLY